MPRPTRYPPTFRAQAVARVIRARSGHTSEWAAIQAVAATLAISAETLRTWVRQAESANLLAQAELRRHRAEIRRLARENAELRRVIGLLRTAVPLVTACTATSSPGERPGSERHGSPSRRAARARHAGPDGGAATAAAT
ncbi:transposase [Frankia tisae]|uniref:transposase n=1 Tax=Frankia tisae TaxID=2950104 RepID=UPI0021BF3064|nr:transposase [Frankia tisae]